MRKLLRGVEHLETFRGEARAFEDDETYVFRTENERRSPHEVVYRSYAVERQAPPAHWPLLAGEAIQALRSALDHALYAAWVEAGDTGDGQHVGFPICHSEADFKKYSWRLAGIPGAVRTIVEESQPYRTLPGAPARERLYLLGTLSNADKHRALATVACAIQHEWIGIRPDITVGWQETATDRPLGQSQTEVELISVFTATSEAEFGTVDVNPAFTYEVRVEAVPVETLVSVAQRVFEVVSYVETGEPLHPGAAYPIYPALP